MIIIQPNRFECLRVRKNHPILIFLPLSPPRWFFLFMRLIRSKLIGILKINSSWNQLEDKEFEVLLTMVAYNHRKESMKDVVQAFHDKLLKLLLLPL